MLSNELQITESNQLYNADYFNSTIQENKKFYKYVRNVNILDRIVFLLFAVFFTLAVFLSSLDSYEKSGMGEAVPNFLIMGFVMFLVFKLIMALYRIFIRTPIWFGVKRTADKGLRKNIPKEFKVGSFFVTKDAWAALAVDYQNRVIMLLAYPYKYDPIYIDTDDVTRISVVNDAEVEIETSFSSTWNTGKATRKVTDNVFLEIHWQRPGKSPSWIAIPFENNRREADSIGAAILKM